MAKRRAHTRTRNHDTSFDKATTTSDPEDTWHPLDHETQAFQAMLEAVRLDPDDPDLADDLQKARAAMTTAWLEHTITPPLPVSRTTFLMVLAMTGARYLRVLVLRSGVHMRKPRL